MQTETSPTNRTPAASFPEWASQEIERLVTARIEASDDRERAQYELQLAVIYDAAQRYGSSLAEAAEL